MDGHDCHRDVVKEREELIVLEGYGGEGGREISFKNCLN